MGCDIHLFTEIKINGKWECLGAPVVERNYALFSKMAGVRGSEEAISKPRGLPVDMSAAVRFANSEMARDGHSHSYLNSDEILILEDWYDETYRGEAYPRCWPSGQWGYCFGNSWGGFAEYPEDRTEGLQDVRFVFWFDN